MLNILAVQKKWFLKGSLHPKIYSLFFFKSVGIINAAINNRRAIDDLIDMGKMEQHNGLIHQFISTVQSNLIAKQVYM